MRRDPGSGRTRLLSRGRGGAPTRTSTSPGSSSACAQRIGELGRVVAQLRRGVGALGPQRHGGARADQRDLRMHRADRLDVEREARTPRRLGPFGRRAAAVARDLELGDSRALRGRERHLEQPAWSRCVAVRAWRLHGPAATRPAARSGARSRASVSLSSTLPMSRGGMSAEIDGAAAGCAGGRRAAIRRRRRGGAWWTRVGGLRRRRPARRRGVLLGHDRGGDANILGGVAGRQHGRRRRRGSASQILSTLRSTTSAALMSSAGPGAARRRHSPAAGHARLEKKTGTSERLLEAVGRNVSFERRLQGEQPFGGLAHRLRKPRRECRNRGVGKQRRKPASVARPRSAPRPRARRRRAQRDLAAPARAADRPPRRTSQPGSASRRSGTRRLPVEICVAGVSTGVARRADRNDRSF